MADFSQIREAIGTGELLPIRYHGGSNPGASREILPIKLDANGRLRARCYTSNAVKVFEISRIEVLDTPISSRAMDLWQRTTMEPQQVPEHPDEVGPAHQAIWIALGWHIRTTSNENGFAFALHRSRRDGKGILKSPSIVLYYAIREKLIFPQPDGSMIEVDGDERPRKWTLCPASARARSFVKYDSAFSALVTEAAKGPQ